MTGALIQLVAQGIQDLYLTNQPQITFFKMVYKRHTNFSIESVPQNFNSRPNFGERVTCTLSNVGDLVGQIYLFIKLPNVPEFVNEDGEIDNRKVFSWGEKIGYGLIKRIELEIGGYLIDRHYGDWLNIWSELTINEKNKKKGLNKMIGNIKRLTSFSNGKLEYNLYIPLQFWFCRNYGLALPLIALRYSEVKIHVEFNRLEECAIIGPTHYINISNSIVHFKKYEYISQTVNNVTCNGIFIDHDDETNRLYYIKINTNNEFKPLPDSSILQDEYSIIGNNSNALALPSLSSIGNREVPVNTELPVSLSLVDSFLYVDYIYLDNEERLKFSQSNHEYLIDVVQFESEKSIVNNNINVKIGFSHPTEEIIWQTRFNFISGGNINDKFNYTTNFNKKKGENITNDGVILLNGQSRFNQSKGQYFNLIQPYQHHNNSPSPGINVYSFSINPKGFQPSGSINLSRIDDIRLKLTLNKNLNYSNPGTLRIYGFSYNVLRIIDGLGGLAFND